MKRTSPPIANYASHRRNILAVFTLTLFLFNPAQLWAQDQSQSQNQDQSATLNLNEADIRVLINTVSEITGKNFIVDPRVKAKVTVISSGPMTKDEIYEVFLSVLEVHGYAAVTAVGATKIIPDINARQAAIPNSYRDKDSAFDQLVTRVVRVNYIAANQLVPLLRALIAQQGYIAAYPPSNLLVISDRASNIDRVLGIINTMDKPDNDEVEVIRLKYASATEMVRILTALDQPTRKDMPPSYQATITSDDRTNSLLVKADRPTLIRMIAIIAELDKPLGAELGNTKVFFLNYAKASDIVSILQGVSAKTQTEQRGGDPARNPASGGNNQVDIQPDEANNAVVITGPPALIKGLEAVIRQLDIPRAQVLIEAIIAEVSTDLSRELGTQILVDGSEDGSGPLGGVIFNDAGNLLSLASDTPNLGQGLTLAVGDTQGNTKFAAVLKALQGDAATNVLSTPSLVTLDNVEAEFIVAQEVPFLTGQFTNTGGGQNVTNPFQTVQRKDVGISLKIKPHINEGDKVKLEIEQEVSSVEATSASAIDITTNKRSLKTEVMVDDGQIVILGGLIQDRFTDSSSKVPLLGSIPILGRLFSFNRTKKVKSNLMIFMRPLILKDDLLTRHITNHKYSLLKARQLDAKIGKRGLIRDSAAKLPEIEVLVTPAPDRPSRENKAVEKEPSNTAPEEKSETPQDNGNTDTTQSPETEKESPGENP